jgi:spore coat polysaccharide biosynthesis protein SpsF
VEQFFQMFQYNNFDYVSNNIYSTYADGFDVQIFKTSTLATSNNLVTTNSEKEHVTMHIKQHKEMFRLLNVIAPLKYRIPDLAVTLDTFEDLHVITRVFEEFAENYFVGFEEITQFLAENPSISAINSKVKRVGYGSS